MSGTRRSLRVTAAAALAAAEPAPGTSSHNFGDDDLLVITSQYATEEEDANEEDNDNGQLRNLQDDDVQQLQDNPSQGSVTRGASAGREATGGGGDGEEVQFVEEPADYGDIHRLVLQGVMAAGFLDAKGVKKLFQEASRHLKCKENS